MPARGPDSRPGRRTAAIAAAVRPEWKPFYAAQGGGFKSWARFLTHEPALRPWSEPAVAWARSTTTKHGVCSWESQEFPKLADRVQILAPLLNYFWLPLEGDEIHARPPKVLGLPVCRRHRRKEQGPAHPSGYSFVSSSR